LNPTSKRRKLLRVVLALVMLIAAGAIFMMTSSRSSRRRVAEAWYYDLTTGKLFPGPVNQYPPIDAPSGKGQGVLVHVYSCGDCTATERKLAYIQRYSEEAQRAVAAGMNPADPKSAAVMLAVADGQMVALIPAQPGDKPEWVPAVPQGQLIRSSWRANCKGSARTCYPNSD